MTMAAAPSTGTASWRREKPADAITTSSLSACSRCKVRSVAKKKAIGMMITSGVGR